MGGTPVTNMQSLEPVPLDFHSSLAIMHRMDYPTFKKTLAHTGLTIREFANLLRMNPNSITNYAKKGDVPTHLGVIVQLIAGLVDRNMDFRKVLAGAQIRPKRKRGIPFGHPFKKLPGKVGSALTQAPAQRPRFWYPADLTIPDASAHQSIPIPEKAHQQGYHAQAVQDRKGIKDVQITMRGRRKEMARRN